MRILLKKKNCKGSTIISKTGKLDNYKKYFKNHKNDEKKRKYYNEYVSLQPYYSFDFKYFFNEYCGSHADTINYFIDLDNNYCLLYDDYNMKIHKEMKALKIFMEIFGIDVLIEIYDLETMRRDRKDQTVDPPFLGRTFHRDIGICIRIPSKNKIISNTKSASKR